MVFMKVEEFRFCVFLNSMSISTSKTKKQKSDNKTRSGGSGGSGGCLIYLILKCLLLYFKCFCSVSRSQILSNLCLLLFTVEQR